MDNTQTHINKISSRENTVKEINSKIIVTGDKCTTLEKGIEVISERHLKIKSSKSHKEMEEEYSKQRPWGSKELGMFEEQQDGPCD